MSAKVTKKLIKKLDKLTNQWSINISKDAVEEEIKDQLAKIQSKVRIDGFRQGKAPIDEIDKRYGEDALYRAVNAIIRNAINQIIEEEKIQLAMQPEVSFTGEIKRKEDVAVNVKITKKPEVPDVKYEKVEIDVAELVMSEEDKQAELEGFRRQMAKQKLVEGEKKVENGDMVDIDFVGKKAEDNSEFPGGNAKGYKLEIGSNSFVKGFEEQIIGHKKGETFDIKVKFPDEYYAEELKGQDAVFTITINDVYTKELPELDDKFAKGLGFENIEKIKDLLFGNVKSILEANMKNLLKDRIFTAIIEKNKFDLPESVIEKEIEERFNIEKEHNKDNKKWNEKDAKKKIEENMHKSYASFYLTDSIAEKNAIDVGEDEIKQVATQDAIRQGMDINDVLDKVEKDEKTKNYLYFTIKEAKVFDFIFEKIKKNVKKLDKKAFEKYLEEERKKLNKDK